MSLTVQSIRFNNFRNYDYLKLSDLETLSIFIGPNAVGKTNLLEGIQLISALSSFRNPPLQNLIQENHDAMSIEATVSDGSRHLDIHLKADSVKRTYYLNGKQKTVAELKGILPAILFSPDDLKLAKRSSGIKRASIDDLGTQLSKNYYIIRRDYNKVIRYKNKLLKTEAAQPLIDSINEILITVGAQLFCYRLSLFNRLIDYAQKNYSRLTDEQECFSAHYTPSWNTYCNTPLPEKRVPHKTEIKEILLSALYAVQPEERAKKRSLIGPHADQIEFFIDSRDVAAFASQGQQRSVVLAWKLAEVDLIKQTLGQNPLLLLDDVMSELDAHRRSALLSFIEGEIQTFITTTNTSYFDPELLQRAQVIQLPLVCEKE